jgi:hypothetical protein
MAEKNETIKARATAQAAGDALEVSLAGTWQITEPRPSWEGLRGA